MKRKPKTIHPLDAACQSDAIRDSVRAREFCIAHAETLVALVSTYSDDAARDLLDTLRETFWTDTDKWEQRVDEGIRRALRGK